MLPNSERFALRKLKEDDLAQVLEWRNFPTIRQNMYNHQEISEEEHQAWWRNSQDGSHQVHLICEADLIPCGVVSFYDISKKYNTAFWAFYASPLAKRGTGSWMELCALDYAFTVLKLHKLSCEVLSFNTSVIKLHEKFGFTVEGRFREQHSRGDERHDIVRLAIFADEWADKRGEIKERLRVVK